MNKQIGTITLSTIASDKTKSAPGVEPLDTADSITHRNLDEWRSYIRAETQPGAHLLLLPAVTFLCDDALEAAVRLAGHNARLHFSDYFLAVATIRLFLSGNLQ